MAARKAHATPTKDFFVRMITKDISLEDCILDLIDNCVDGARKVRHARTGDPVITDYSGFSSAVELRGDSFRVADNCGGISISEAIDYAFHFGRRANAPTDEDYAIGLYGIGMKRAIFKIGNQIEIFSSTDKEAFRALINVAEWLTRTRVTQPGEPPVDDWDFDLEDAAVLPATGTIISIADLYPAIGAQFANPEFINGLARIVARDYSQFIAKGFEIFVNGRKIPGFTLTVRESDAFKPVRLAYTDETGVRVEVIAGMAGLPPDDLQPQDQRAETDNYGWFVLCNDRVVVAADKSNQTVWGDSGFPAWHYQYNGFIGVVSFHAKDANLLPWKTTKRDVDRSNATYRRALERMKEVTRPWLQYTNDRKGDLGSARKREAQAQSMPLFSTAINAKMAVPKAATTAVAVGTIQYQKPLTDIEKAKKLLGKPTMPNYKVGIETFDYFLKHESEG